MNSKYAIVVGSQDEQWIQKPGNGGDVGDMRDVVDELNRLMQERDELKRWKREALQVESEWDPHKLAELLGAPPGSSARVEIMQRVTQLVKHVKALEEERDQAKSEAAFWMNL